MNRAAPPWGGHARFLSDPDGEVTRWEPPYVGENLPPLGDPSPPEPEYRLPTAAEIAAIEEAARETGYQTGFDQGYREGRERAVREAEVAACEAQKRADAELGAAVAALEDIARALADPLAGAIDTLEPELLSLVTTLARQVVLAELVTRPELVQTALRRALEQLPSRKQPLRIRAHPLDCALLEQHRQEPPETVAWLPDDTLTRGGCVVESGPSRVDATLERRLHQAVEAIWGDLAAAAAEPDENAAPEARSALDPT